jgi:hypothetical protein
MEGMIAAREFDADSAGRRPQISQMTRMAGSGGPAATLPGNAEVVVGAGTRAFQWKSAAGRFPARFH